jgi:hypothetical protein
MFVPGLQILVHREAGGEDELCRGGSGACEPTLRDLNIEGPNKAENKASGNKV